jgi:hypothetical protein
MSSDYKAFMVMPFSNDSVKSAYNHVVKPICEQKSISIRKADEIFSTKPVYDDIVREIQKADIIVVDITDNNPNVFYELGMAHTLKQQQTIILTNDKFDETPFDIAHFRIIQYKDTIEGKENFSKKLSSTLDYILKKERLLNEDEFQIVQKTLESSEKRSQLLILVGMNELDLRINQSEGFIGEGHVGTKHTTFSSMNVVAGANALVELDYLTKENEFYFVSSKGKAFAEYLKEKDYVCDVLNGNTITENFTPFRDRIQSNEDND